MKLLGLSQIFDVIERLSKCFLRLASLLVVLKAWKNHVRWRVLKTLFRHGLTDQRGMCASTNVFYRLLQGCVNRKDLRAGREVQGLIAKAGFEASSFLGSHLIRMFAACGSLFEANQVFIKLMRKDVFTWSAIISAHTKSGKSDDAIKLYDEMKQSTVKPDKCVFVAVLKACTCATALTKGKIIHADIIESGLELDVFVGSTLVDMHAKCGSLDDARKVFDKLPERVLVTWNAMIAGYALHSCSEEAIELFQQMQHQGLLPNNVTFVSTLKACSVMAPLNQCKWIHVHIIECGLEADTFVGNALITFYAKHRNLKDSCTAFDKISQQDVVTWSSLIAAYVQHGHDMEAIELLQQMFQEGVEPNEVTFLNILRACSLKGALNQVMLIHFYIVDRGFEADVCIASSLIDMYTRCGNMEDAYTLFKKCPKRDLIMWNSMISSCAQHGYHKKALRLFQQMPHNGREPDHVTYVSILKACYNTADRELVRLVHACIIEDGFEGNAVVGSNLIYMYASCGSLMDSCRVFDKLLKQNIVTWNAMITGYTLHNRYERALQCLQGMQQEGLNPNDTTFLCLLTLCSHIDLMEEGIYFLKSMREDYGLTPQLEHYSCIVDLLGHAGRLGEAENLLQTMPYRPNCIGWRSLLHHCKTYGNVEQGRRCFDNVVSMGHLSASEYMLMSKIYAGSGMWEDAGKIQDLRHCACIWKEPGMAFISVGRKMYDFIAGGGKEPESDVINGKLCRLSMQLIVEGHVPHVDLVLQ